MGGWGAQEGKKEGALDALLTQRVITPSFLAQLVSSIHPSPIHHGIIAGILAQSVDIFEIQGALLAYHHPSPTHLLKRGNCVDVDLDPDALGYGGVRHALVRLCWPRTIRTSS